MTEAVLSTVLEVNRTSNVPPSIRLLLRNDYQNQLSAEQLKRHNFTLENQVPILAGGPIMVTDSGDQMGW